MAGGEGRGHGQGLRLVGEEAELASADVETGGADEGPSLPCGAGGGGDGARHRGGRRGPPGRGPAPGLQGEVIWRGGGNTSVDDR